MGSVLNYCQYGVLYLGSYYNTEPYIHFPHFWNSNLGKLPYTVEVESLRGRVDSLGSCCRAKAVDT